MDTPDANQEYLNYLWAKASALPSSVSVDGFDVECSSHEQVHIITITKNGASTRDVYVRRREQGEFRRWQHVGTMTKTTAA